MTCFETGRIASFSSCWPLTSAQIDGFGSNVLFVRSLLVLPKFIKFVYRNGVVALQCRSKFCRFW